MLQWDLDNPYTLDITVQPEDIDGLGHANNTVYVSWLERCAWQHSSSLGLGVENYRTLDRAMAVFRHEIDYLRAAYEGDDLVMATWIVHWDKKLRMTRHFQLCRVSDGATLLRARTTFVCIEVSTGKPKRMPPVFIEVYAKGMTEDKPDGNGGALNRE
jgi:acyl-CoA thioester hydrolase